ncbi:HU family DNA-binding protein [uncultured Polaribacter sp.]|uniref:HU family DNA-binding protein n=1 Tax=uncultured Polaribacter sp. TaxID=174711 RepID=UPI0026108C10|nr:HU family DNA-binding protein [uncultured Polaribacter sp.]
MPVKIKALERGEPGVAGGGIKKWYATTAKQDERNIEALTTSIEKISTVSGADIRAVLYALVDVCIEELSYGNVVRIGELGNLRVGVSSEGVATQEEVTTALIKKARILFAPGSRLKVMRDTLTYQKV